jgi:hypothetical protein
VTILLVGLSEVQIPAGTTDVSRLQNARTTGFHPACYSLPTVGVFPELSGRGVELTPRFPSSAEVQNEWSYTSTPLYVYHAVDRDNFTFLAFCLQENFTE